MARGRPASNAAAGELSRTYAAWERFAAGEDEPGSVPLTIALSWHRCRDLYRLDPWTAQPPATTVEPTCRGSDGAVFAELGGIGSAIANRSDPCVTTLTDGHGRVMATWGSRPARRRAQDSGYAPGYLWAESVVGTNGVGTALVPRHVSTVRGPEHWAIALHEWNSTGVAVCDPVTGTALATLTVSAWRHALPLRSVDLLVETRPIGVLLRRAELRHRAAIVDAFAALERRTTGPLVAIDLGGRVIAANAAADRRTGHRGALTPDAGAGWPLLRAALDGPDECHHPIPVTAGADPIGFLLQPAPHPGPGDHLPDGADTPLAERSGPPARVAALGDHGRLVLLPPAEIRYARAEGHAVWLVTDRGSLRAARRGIDQVERELAGHGFLRVHRGYLVNLARVRDVTSERGSLTISTVPGRNERIPVSRRSLATVRRALGL